MTDGCKYNPIAIQCTDWKVSESFCLRCGWNPKVAEARKEELFLRAKGKRPTRIVAVLKKS